MNDMEKVKYDIERCICHVPDACRDCSHYKHGEYLDCMEELLKDALFLLKEKEQKTGHWVSVNDGNIVAIDNDGFPERACFCSECKKYLIASDEYAVYGRYCPFCGAKMEGR